MARKSFSIKIDSQLSQIAPRARRACLEVLSDGAHQIELHAEHAIQTGPKTGRLYEKGEVQVSFKSRNKKGEEREVSFTARKGKASKLHQASAPGEAPASDEGHLVNSIASGTRISGELLAEVTVGAEYAAALEFGTDDGQLAARPFLGPAFDAVEPAVVAALGMALREAAEG